MEKKRLLIVILLLVLVVAGAALLYRNLGAGSTLPAVDSSSDGSGSTPAVTVPDFTVYTLDGEAVSLSDFRGKPVVLNFWASTCGFCVQEMPAFQQAYEELGSEVHFLMVNVTDGSWDTSESAQAYIDDSGFTLPFYLDTDLNAAMLFGLRGLPATFFLSDSGTLIGQRSGMMNYETLLGGIGLIYQ